MFYNVMYQRSKYLEEGIKKRRYRQKVHEKYYKDEQLMNKTLKDL